MTEKECKKYSEFTADGTDRCTWQQGASISIVTKINNKKLNGAYNSIRPFSSSMRMLYFAKLVEKWEGFDLPTTNVYYNKQENDLVPVVFNNGNNMLNTEIVMHALFPSSSYDKKIYISFLGWKKIGNNMRVDGGMPRYLNYLEYNEVLNDNWFSNINEHNTIMMKYLESSKRDEHNIITSTSTKASLNAKLTSELDAKIDDGRPGSGRFLAFKNVNDPRYCYDKTSAEVHLAIYNSDTNNKYGCNIIKVMEDVK